MIVIAVPACNESKNLRNCIETLMKEAPPLGEDFHIVIAEDGSTDGTDLIAQKLEQKHPQVTHLHSPCKLGKGLALRQAFNAMEGDIYAFIDCDLATDMKFFPKLINSVREGNDLALGSRYMKGADANRVVLRDFPSRVYNGLIRLLFKDPVQDHQIGFKAFSRRLIKDVLNECDSTGWFWDTEIIIRSIHSNYKIVEFPVEWEEKKKDTSSFKMVVAVTMQNVRGIIGLKKILSK
ncbi:MAG: glycosyl transferase [Candidatus Bathyarchaeum sp.]|nr:MAG: glycosyl transferase [Candidatus Bathyarchaeum sp.]